MIFERSFPMPVLALAMMILCMAGLASAETDISLVCHTTCEKSTHSNPDYKACLTRGADKADRALN
jgi:hypothetical protein